MATQICRPCTSSCRRPALIHNSSRKGAAVAFSRQVFRKQMLPSALDGFTKRVALHQIVTTTGGCSHLPKAVFSAETGPPPENRDQHGVDIFKLVAKLLPLVLPIILFRTAPAFATTVAVTRNAANGFRVPELLTSAWTGLMAGCLHTLTGPDHLAALAPLSIGRTKLEGAVVGALWGCGHDAGQIMFGLLFLVLKDKLHIDLLRTWSARVVGVTLLAIGAIGIKEAQEAPVPCLAGEGCEADYDTSEDRLPQRKKPFGLATFGTGVVHGLQPDALLVILPALALPSRVAGVAFLFMFLIGTVVAMASYTAFVGSCSEALQKRVPWITQRLSLGSSLIAIAVGFSILLGEVFGINLF